MMSAMNELRDAVAALGVDPEEIEAAEASGTLLGLIAERFLLPGEKRYDHEDLAARTGLHPDEVKKLWLALGFPEPVPGEKAFREGDLEAVRTLLSDGTTITEYMLHETRAISSSLVRIAEVFVDEMWDQHFKVGQTQAEAIGEMSGAIDLQRIEGLLIGLLRRQIVAAIYRRMALHDREMREGLPSLAIGFADIAGYSALSQALEPKDLTDLVVGFEKETHDLIAQMNGRVVKTIGDEVMFLFEDARTAAVFALRLSSVAGLPALRIGLGSGPVLTRQGDCFGPTVNLTSRVVGVAAAGEIVVESGMARALDKSEFVLTSLGERSLKGFGDVELWRLEDRQSQVTSSYAPEQ